MSRRPDFYCFFYCAAWDRSRGTRTQRHAMGSGPLPTPSPVVLRRRPQSGCDGVAGRPSGSRGVGSKAQRLIPIGRPGIDGLRVWQTSPLGSNRRGR